ncbi:MAG: HK97-gp10 family putative phage morphogenesis protein [Phycisphaerales bacterium]
MPPIASGFKVHADLGDLRRKMDQLGVRIATNVVRRGLLAGAGLMRDDARRRVSVRRGALKKAIIAETDRKGSTRERIVANVKIAPRAFTVTAKGRLKAVSKKVQKERKRRSIKGEIYPRNYAHLVEYGTRPHHVGKGSKLSKGKASGLLHPGARPRPYMRPAYDAKSAEARQLVERVVKAEFVKELAKFAVRSSGKGAAA